jgi:hypothetical protein
MGRGCTKLVISFAHNIAKAHRKRKKKGINSKERWEKPAYLQIRVDEFTRLELILQGIEGTLRQNDAVALNVIGPGCAMVFPVLFDETQALREFVEQIDPNTHASVGMEATAETQ